MMGEAKSKLIRVNIRNTEDPRSPRVFDVMVDLKGNIHKYLIQNIRGFQYVNMDDVEFQIQQALKKAS